MSLPDWAWQVVAILLWCVVVWVLVGQVFIPGVAELAETLVRGG